MGLLSVAILECKDENDLNEKLHKWQITNADKQILNVSGSNKLPSGNSFVEIMNSANYTVFITHYQKATPHG